VIIQEPSHTIWAVDFAPLAQGANPFVIGLAGANRLTLQWIVHADVVGASATIALHGAISDRAADIVVLDPATNPYWSPLLDEANAAITFAALPAAVIASSMRRIPRVSFSAILAIITVAGADYTKFSFGARITG
jgi:hypothetical protein